MGTVRNKKEKKNEINIVEEGKKRTEKETAKCRN
jgi:hypothetical protein